MRHTTLREKAIMNTTTLTALLQKAQKQIKQNNARKRYDINRQWEKIAQSILNIAYGWNLEDLNLVRPDFPGIDLGDLVRHIGVQVSTNSRPEKIRETMNKIQNNENNGRRIADDYYNLYFFVPGEKQKSYRTEFNLQPPIQFTTDHIIDFQVFEEIFCGLDEEKQEAILMVLNRELNKKPKYQLSAAPTTTCDFIEGSRQREMEAIDEKFSKSNRVFLWGLGGIGKTELAVQWGLNRADVYLVHYKKSILDTVLDMDFSGMAYIPSRSEMTNAEKKEEEFRQRLDILREYYQNATFIIDNFDDGETTLTELQNRWDYKALMKLPNKFLFTTRFMVRESAVHVTELDEEDLMQIIRQNYDIFWQDGEADTQPAGMNAGKCDETLRKLIRKVDGHTLTVDLLSKTLYESFGRLTPEKLLAAFDENQISDSDMPVVSAYHNSSESDYDLQERRMYDHLRILFNLSELDVDHLSVMRHAVLLPLAGIPVSMFRRCHTPEEQEAMERKILHRSWLRLDRTHTLISMHSVIREVCRRELEPDDENCRSFLQKLSNCVNVHHDNQELYKLVAETMGNAAEILPDVLGEWNRAAGDAYRLLGMYRKALDYLKQACAICESYNNAALADLYSSMGNTYTNLKEFETAIAYHEKSLAICQSLPQPDAKSLARRYNDMGVAYSYQAEKNRKLATYEKAIAYYEEALKYNRQEETVNELHISNTLNNIGNTYSNIGKTWHDAKNYELALNYHLEAIDLRENIPNISCKNLARSYKNIGNDYANLKRDGEALEYRMKALKLYKKVLHGGHPELANAYQDVGNTYRLTENLAEAFRYYAEAEKIWQKQLPQNEFYLAKCRYAIGLTYSHQAAKGENCQYGLALEYYKKALEGYQKSMKSSNKDLARCKAAIGETYLKLGNRREALQYLKEYNTLQTRDQNKRKYKEIKRYHHLGELCKKEKQSKEALDYYQKVLQIREAYFLQDTGNLIETYFEIGCIYRDLRQPQEAMTYLEKALMVCENNPDQDQKMQRKKLHKISKTIEITKAELKKCP